MSTAYGNRPIVSDGLVLCLDAANPRSYSGTGTTWNDLSGNGNHGTLVNNPTHDSTNKLFSFDGASDYVSFTYRTPLQNLSTSFTWEILVFNRSSDVTIIMGNRYPLPGEPLKFIKLTPSRFEYYSDSFLNGAIDTNQWSHIMIVKNQTALTRYTNGQVINTDTLTISEDRPPQDFFIGGQATAENSNIDVSACRVYNRALTAQEVQQNFNAMRGRYGI